MKNFGARIRSRREKLGLTQVQLAEKASSSEASVIKWEALETSDSGISRNSRIRLAAALQANPEWLRTGEGHEELYQPIEPERSIALQRHARAVATATGELTVLSPAYVVANQALANLAQGLLPEELPEFIQAATEAAARIKQARRVGQGPRS